MKLSVGMYVRTNLGTIGKIQKINIGIFELLTQDNKIILKGNGAIKKASHNIIDLIEVGDYVNGYKVEEIDNNEKCLIFDLENNGEPLHYYEKDIKSILTKEQYEANMYVVKEDL